MLKIENLKVDKNDKCPNYILYTKHLQFQKDQNTIVGGVELTMYPLIASEMANMTSVHKLKEVRKK